MSKNSSEDHSWVGGFEEEEEEDIENKPLIPRGNGHNNDGDRYEGEIPLRRKEENDFTRNTRRGLIYMVVLSSLTFFVIVIFGTESVEYFDDDLGFSVADDYVETNDQQQQQKPFSSTGLERISILGERNSGASYLANKLSECFPSIEVTPSLRRPAFFFQPKDPIKKSLKPTLVISIFRDPYIWVDEMRKNPKYAPAHKNMGWYEFVTTPWTMSRPKMNNLHEEAGTCQFDFEYNEIIPCSSNGKSNLGAYEMRESGDPYESIIALRRDKILNLMRVADYEEVVEILPVTYEQLQKDVGFSFLLENIQAETGIIPSCDFNTKLSLENDKLWTVNENYAKWMNQNVDWEVENLVGYKMKYNEGNDKFKGSAKEDSFSDSKDGDNFSDSKDGDAITGTDRWKQDGESEDKKIYNVPSYDDEFFKEPKPKNFITTMGPIANHFNDDTNDDSPHYQNHFNGDIQVDHITEAKNFSAVLPSDYDDVAIVGIKDETNHSGVHLKDKETIEAYLSVQENKEFTADDMVIDDINIVLNEIKVFEQDSDANKGPKKSKYGVATEMLELLEFDDSAAQDGTHETFENNLSGDGGSYATVTDAFVNSPEDDDRTPTGLENGDAEISTSIDAFVNNPKHNGKAQTDLEEVDKYNWIYHEETTGKKDVKVDEESKYDDVNIEVMDKDMKVEEGSEDDGIAAVINASVNSPKYNDKTQDDPVPTRERYPKPQQTNSESFHKSKTDNDDFLPLDNDKHEIKSESFHKYKTGDDPPLDEDTHEKRSESFHKSKTGNTYSLPLDEDKHETKSESFHNLKTDDDDFFVLVNDKDETKSESLHKSKTDNDGFLSLDDMYETKSEFFDESKTGDDDFPPLDEDKDEKNS